jgi:hypothetical protein
VGDLLEDLGILLWTTLVLLTASVISKSTAHRAGGDGH